MIFGMTAIALSQSPDPSLTRWACIFGLCSQPFWFISAYRAKQWGIFAISFAYTAVWMWGYYNFWVLSA